MTVRTDITTEPFSVTQNGLLEEGKPVRMEKLIRDSLAISG